MELHHPIMSKLWDIGGQTKRKRKKRKIYYLNSCQVVAAQLKIENFFHELTNIIVFLASPDGCGVFPMLLAQHIISYASHLIIC